MSGPRVRWMTVLAGALVGVGLAGAGVAFAYFTFTDAANAAGARATAATLSAPAAPTATADGGGSVTVGWTLPSSQLAGAQYQVTRTTGPGAPSTVCTVSAATTSCQDAGLTPGSVYAYSVAALLGGWQSGSVVASTTTSVPTLSLTLSAGPYAAGTPVTVTQVQAMLGASVDTSMSGTVPITWSGLASSPTGVAPTYPAGAVTFTNGVATPNAPFTPSDADASTLTATDAAAPGTTGSVAFTVAPGVASRLQLTAQPSGASGGTAFSSQPAVAVDDADGNVVPSDASTATLAIAPGTPTSGGPGALSGCASSESLGVFTFSGCRVTTAGSGYELTATDGSLTAATTAAFDVTVGPSAQLAIRTQPAGASGGSAFATQPQVVVEDAGGNVVTSDASTVTLSIASGTPVSGGPGTLSGCSPTETSGVVAFGGCSISTTGTGYRLAATDGALSAVTSAAFNVVAGTATQLAFTLTPGASTGGAVFAVQPRVTLLDAGGNVASGSSSSITLAVASGTGTLACTTNPVATSSGVATFAGCKITLGTDGTFSLRASATGYAPITSGTFTVYGAATKVIFTTQPTSSTGGGALSTQPVVAVEDAASNVVPTSSAPVTLSISTGAGTLACTANPLAATAGVASFGGCAITLGTQGSFKLSAASSGLTAATSSAFTVAGAATKLVLTTQPTASTGGTALTTQPVVAVEDSSGDVVTASSAPVALAIASGTGTLACGADPVTPKSGVAAFAGCAISLGTAGSFTLSATSAGLTTATSSSFTVAGAATKLVFTTQPSTATGGSPFSTQPVVKVEDASGDVVTTSSAPVTLAVATGSGTLACTTIPVTSASGVAAFAGCAITLGSQGSFTLSATSPGLTTVTSSSFTVAGAASKLVVTTQPSNASSGTAFSTQPVVKVEDASGDVVTTSSVPVTLAVATGSGTLACTTNPVTSASGVATFAACAITLGTPGSFTLSATSSGLSTATSASFTVAGTASQLVFTAQPSSSTGGAAFSSQPVVKVEDASGDVVTSSSVSVTLAIATGSGTLACTTNPVTAVAGVATFAGCKVTLGTQGSFTLSATASGLAASTTSAFTVAGPASQLAFTTQPSNATGGTAFGTQPVVKVEDASGDVVTTSAASVTLAIASGSGVLACTSNPATASAGVATFAGCKVTLGTPGSFTVSAASSGLTASTSTSFTVAGAASKLVFGTQPVGSAHGVPFVTQPVIEVEDASGDVVTTSALSVSLSITAGSGTPGATLSCTANPVAAVSGVVTFAGCTISLAGSGYTLSASGYGVTAGISATFTMT